MTIIETNKYYRKKNKNFDKNENFGFEFGSLKRRN